MAMISPELRHSFLLSSSTVFMFSIQMASTGPSKMTHLRSGLVSRAAFLKGAEQPQGSQHSTMMGNEIVPLDQLAVRARVASGFPSVQKQPQRLRNTSNNGT